MPWFLLLFAAPAAFAIDYTLVLDRDGSVTRTNAARAAQRFSPCSTFKIPNALIALDLGNAPDADYTMKYDAARDPRTTFWLEEWGGDHDLRSAMRFSVVWYFKELARRAGAERMSEYLRRFDYGNQDISGGIDRFWLSSTLRISPEEQVAFLRKFQKGRLGVSSKAAVVLKDILILERGDGYVWSGKTGACGDTAWHVGYVERNGKPVFYALNLGGAPFNDLVRERNRLVRELLVDAGLLPRTP
ncbi:MAG: class D beta-lactamase [Bryobacterales bacterium]|nr:class D beta-lactamase [Bryobacterales bacterium]